MDPEKIQSIREYFQKLFPSAEHADKEDFTRIGHKYRITNERRILLTSISRELIDDNTSEEIVSILERINIGKSLESNPSATVLVTSSGVRIEPIN